MANQTSDDMRVTELGGTDTKVTPVPAVTKAKAKQPVSKGKVIQHRKPAIESRVKEALVLGGQEVGESLRVGLAGGRGKQEEPGDWKKSLEDMTKKERIEKIREVKKAVRSEQKTSNLETKKFMVVGFKEVMKAVQKNGVKIVLVDSKLPENVLCFLLPLCQSRSVNVLGLQKLDQISQDTLGFKSSVIGLKGILMGEENPLKETIGMALETLRNSSNQKTKDKLTGQEIYPYFETLLK
jgi:ribosomal protein L7Ae-like RNA K-turn-binding protein